MQDFFYYDWNTEYVYLNRNKKHDITFQYFLFTFFMKISDFCLLIDFCVLWRFIHIKIPIQDFYYFWKMSNTNFVSRLYRYIFTALSRHVATNFFNFVTNFWHLSCHTWRILRYCISLLFSSLDCWSLNMKQVIVRLYSLSHIIRIKFPANWLSFAI